MSASGRVGSEIWISLRGVFGSVAPDAKVRVYVAGTKWTHWWCTLLRHPRVNVADLRLGIDATWGGRLWWVRLHVCPCGCKMRPLAGPVMGSPAHVEAAIETETLRMHIRAARTWRGRLWARVRRKRFVSVTS